jgi:hypothetical protein
MFTLQTRTRSGIAGCVTSRACAHSLRAWWPSLKATICACVQPNKLTSSASAQVSSKRWGKLHRFTFCSPIQHENRLRLVNFWSPSHYNTSRDSSVSMAIRLRTRCQRSDRLWGPTQRDNQGHRSFSVLCKHVWASGLPLAAIWSWSCICTPPFIFLACWWLSAVVDLPSHESDMDVRLNTFRSPLL